MDQAAATGAWDLSPIPYGGHRQVNLYALGEHLVAAMEIFLECKRQRSRPAGGGCGLRSEKVGCSEYKPQPPPAGRERWRFDSKKVSIATTAGRITVRRVGSGALPHDRVAFWKFKQAFGAKPHAVAQYSRLHSNKVSIGAANLRALAFDAGRMALRYAGSGHLRRGNW